MSLPALPMTADSRRIAEATNVLIREYNGRHDAIAVASLPATPGFFDRHMVNDANATTFWSIVAGGGANTVPVTWDGTNWRIG